MDDVTFDLRGFIENSLLEWENHVAAVVIAGGCNLRCPYCHSWRYVTGLGDLERLDPEIVFDLLKRQKGWIDGVVFTGGEPTLQPGLAEMIRRAREYEVEIKLHTNGTRPDVVAALLDEGLLDCLALDYKAPLDERYFQVSGIRPDAGVLDAIGRTFALAAAANVRREYHTTLDPLFVSEETLADMAARLEPEGVWFLQQYETDDCLSPAAAGSRRYGNDELDRLAGIAGAAHKDLLLKRGKSWG